MVAPAATLIARSPVPPLWVEAEIPYSNPETVVPAASFTVTLPFPKLKALMPLSAGAVIFALLLMMTVPFTAGFAEAAFPYPAQIPSGCWPLPINVVPAFIEPVADTLIVELADAAIVVELLTAAMPELPAVILPLLIVILPDP